MPEAGNIAQARKMGGIRGRKRELACFAIIFADPADFLLDFVGRGC
jgi:hypothetical protein